MNLNGNTVLITGGGSGIGRALAEEFQKRGNHVIIAGRRKERLLQTVAANPGMESLEMDIASRTSILDAAAFLMTNYRKLNVVINNAGIMQLDDVADGIDDDLIVSTIETNLVGPIRLVGALLEYLKKQDSSTVMIVSSALALLQGRPPRFTLKPKQGFTLTRSRCATS